MDPLMTYINQNSKDFGVTVQYATLSEYFQAVYQANLTWDVRGGEDFLPYSSGECLYPETDTTLNIYILSLLTSSTVATFLRMF